MGWAHRQRVSTTIWLGKTHKFSLCSGLGSNLLVFGSWVDALPIEPPHHPLTTPTAPTLTLLLFGLLAISFRTATSEFAFCMCVTVCVCMHVCVYVHACMCACMCVHVYGNLLTMTCCVVSVTSCFQHWALVPDCLLMETCPTSLPWYVHALRQRRRWRQGTWRMM